MLFSNVSKYFVFIKHSSPADVLFFVSIKKKIMCKYLLLSVDQYFNSISFNELKIQNFFVKEKRVKLNIPSVY